MLGTKDPLLVKASEVMRLLGISRPTLYRWVKKGVIKPALVNKKMRYFLWEDIMKLIQGGSHGL